MTKSELERHNKRFDGISLLSTPTGIQVARDFGAALPVDRRYRLYHTWVERAKETAEGIKTGIVENGGVAEVAGVIPYSMTPRAENIL